MTMKHLFSATLIALAALGATAAGAHEFKQRDIRIVHPYAVPSLAGVPNGMAFVDLQNQGRAGDRLVRLSSPAAAGVEVHEMKTDAGVMKMRPLDGLALAPGRTVKMADSGLHLMLVGLKAPLKTGDKVPVTLVFEKSGETTVDFWVQDRATGDAAMHRHHDHKH